MPLFITACGTTGKPDDKVSHYVLEYPAPPAPVIKKVPALARVKRFSVAPPYNTTRMIFRQDSFKRDEYIFHRWRVNPGDMVTDFFARDVREAGLFLAVLPYDGAGSSDFLITGSVDEFLELDTEKTWIARLAVTFVLLAEGERDATKKLVMQKSYRTETEFPAKTPQAFAEAMSRSMAHISKMAVSDMYRALTEKSGDRIKIGQNH